jgi:hypothetical protein
LAPLERQDQLVHKPRASAAWWACAFLALTGCRTFARIPPPQPKTIEELYYEAQAAAKPEVNLGFDHPLRPELHEVVSSPPPRPARRRVIRICQPIRPPQSSHPSCSRYPPEPGSPRFRPRSHRLLPCPIRHRPLHEPRGR